jgi:Na+/H+ antiporter NhaD/arsenite permease-like protein
MIVGSVQAETFLMAATHTTSDVPDPAHSEALWWSLAIGADFGGNMTAVGSSANVVRLGIAARPDSGHLLAIHQRTP